MKIIKIKAKNIFIKTNLPGADFMINREKFSGFLDNLKDIIKKENINTAGIEVHFPTWKTIKV